MTKARLTAPCKRALVRAKHGVCACGLAATHLAKVEYETVTRGTKYSAQPKCLGHAMSYARRHKLELP